MRQPTRRPVAPGGWRRAALAFGVGAVAGALLALVLPRDDGPRRRDVRTALGGTPDAG